MPKPPGRHDERLRVLDEHRLADEEVAEVDAEVDPLVEALLERQLDAETDREAAGLAGPAVGRLHRPRAAAGDHRVAGFGQRGSELAARPVLGRFGSVRADPKTVTALGISASASNPSTNSPWMRSTRQGSVCSHWVSSRWSSRR